MTRNRLYVYVICSWFALFVIATLAAVAAGVSLSLTTVALVGALACVPPVILVKVFRGAGDRSLAGVLYDTEHQNASKDGGR